MNAGIVRAALLGSKLRIAGTFAAGLVVLAGLAVALGVVGAPGVAAVDNDFGGVNESTTVIETDLVVDNPNPVGISTGDVRLDYAVRLNGVEMATGSREGVAVGTGNSTVEFTSYMDNRQIPEWWYRHVDSGERSRLVVDAEVASSRLGRGTDFRHETTVETDVIGEFDSNETREVDPDSPVLDAVGFGGPLMYVNETSGEWGEATREETPMNLDFVAYNPQPVPYTLTRVEYEISMNGVRVGEGATDREYVIEPGERERIETTTAIRNDELDEWWVTHLENDQVSDLEIRFYAVAEVQGQTFRFPLEPLDYEDTIETSIFEDDGADERAE